MKDLHIHTKYSDGEFDEQQILEEIESAGITEFAICDHDTITGSQKVFELLKKQNKKIIFHSGIELTCRLNYFNTSINMHILFYDFDYDCPALKEIISEISYLRKKRISQMVNYVQDKLKVSIPQSMICKEFQETNSFGKPHLFKIISKICPCDRALYYDIMDKFDSSAYKLDAEKTIQKLAPFGLLVLAHPVEIMKEYNFDLQTIEKIVLCLKKSGLKGIETHHSSQTKQLQAQLSALAQKHMLIETMGSDFHGPKAKPNAILGQTEKII